MYCEARTKMINRLTFVGLIGVVMGYSICGIESHLPEDRIIGGENTSIESVPHQVSIAVEGRHYCGASIIEKNWILTAAHCCQLAKSFYAIRAGTTNAQIGGTLHRVSLVKVHENYRVDESGIPIHDVCLIRLIEPFLIDATRRAIELFQTNEEPRIGTAATVTGWGTISTTANISPSKLQIVTVPIISQVDCVNAYRYLANITDDQMCALYKGGGKDACQGDSGGPLSVDNRLAGIVSWGYGCAKPFYPGVYTKVSYYREWIDETMKA